MNLSELPRWYPDDPVLIGLSAESLLTRLQLVSAVRGLIEQMASSSAGDDTLLAATHLVSQATAMLADGPHRPGYVRAVEGVLTGLGPHGELGPFTGAMHVFAPRFSLVAAGEGLERTVTGLCTYGNAYEGVHGLVQGGFIVATFDEILGLVQAGFGRMTADIQISYRAPAPLHQELRYTACVERVEGRKAFVTGALHHGDTLCATAKGLFIAPRPTPQSPGAAS